MKRIGYIKIDRSILYHPALQKKDRSFCEIGAWLWLLLEASFLDRKFRIGNSEVKLKRGQLCSSLTYMANAFNWHKSKVQRYLDRLILNGSITTETPKDAPADMPNIITICQYDLYQDTPSETPKSAKQINDQNKFTKELFDDVWSKLKVKRGTKANAYKSFLRLFKNKDLTIIDYDSTWIIEKYNQKCDSVSEKKFIPHFSTWLNNEGWTEELIKEKTKEDNFGIVPTDRFRNLELWKKGIKTINDFDDDIILKYKEGEISEEAMKRMNLI